MVELSGSILLELKDEEYPHYAATTYVLIGSSHINEKLLGLYLLNELIICYEYGPVEETIIGAEKLNQIFQGDHQELIVAAMHCVSTAASFVGGQHIAEMLPLSVEMVAAVVESKTLLGNDLETIGNEFIEIAKY